MDNIDKLCSEGLNIVLNAFQRGGIPRVTALVIDLLRRNQSYRLENESLKNEIRKLALYEDKLKNQQPYVKSRPNGSILNSDISKEIDKKSSTNGSILNYNISKEIDEKKIWKNLSNFENPKEGVPHPLKGCRCTACIKLIEIPNIHIYTLETRHENFLTPNGKALIQEKDEEKICTILYIGHQRNCEIQMSPQMASKLRPLGAVVHIWPSEEEVFVTLDKIIYIFGIDATTDASRKSTQNNMQDWPKSSEFIDYSQGYKIGENIVNNIHSSNHSIRSIFPEIPNHTYRNNNNNNNMEEDLLLAHRYHESKRFSLPQLSHLRGDLIHRNDRDLLQQVNSQCRKMSLPVTTNNQAIFDFPNDCINYGITGRRLSDTLDSAVGPSLDGSNLSLLDYRDLYGSRHSHNGGYCFNGEKIENWSNCTENYLNFNEMMRRSYF